jgi:hypothetical protein
VRVDARALRWHLAKSADIYGTVLLDAAPARSATAVRAAWGYGDRDDSGEDEDADAEGDQDHGDEVEDNGDAANHADAGVRAAAWALQPALADAAEVQRSGVRTVPVYLFSLAGDNAARPTVLDNNGSVAV